MFKQVRVLLQPTMLLRALISAPTMLPARTRDASESLAKKEEEFAVTQWARVMPANNAGMVNGHRFFQGVSISSRFDKKPFHLELICDGRSRHLQSNQIAIGLGRYVDEKPIAEADGLNRSSLFFSSHTPPGRLQRLKPQPPTGRCGEIEVTQACSIQIITDEPMTVYADGKPVTRTPATFTFFDRP